VPAIRKGCCISTTPSNPPRERIGLEFETAL